MSALWEHLQTCCHDSGTAATVSGFPGAGRTFLLNLFTEKTAAAGVMTLHASACVSEQGSHFGIIEQLFTDNTHALEQLAELGAGGHTTPTASAVLAAQRLVGKVLAEMSAQGPVVVAVDDVHYSDETSLRILKFLCNRLKRLRLFIILSGRGPTQRRFQELQASLMQAPRLLVLEIARLTPETATRLVLDVTGHRPAQHYIREALERTGGNARLLWAVAHDTKHSVRDLPPSQWIPVEGPVLRDSVLLMTSARHFETLQCTARALAVLEDVPSVDSLSTLCGVLPDRVSADLSLLEAAGLLKENRFRTSSIRSAVLDDPDFTERAELTRRAAQQLYQRGAPPREVAEKIMTVGSVGAVWEVTVLREAARQARSEGAWRTAVDLLVLAHSFEEEHAAWVETLLELTQAKWMADPYAASSHLSELLDAGRSGRMPPGVMVNVAQMLAWHGRLAEAGEALKLLREQGGDTPEVLSQIEGVSSLLRLYFGPFPQDALNVPGPETGPPAKALNPFDLAGLPESGGSHDRASRVRLQKVQQMVQAWFGEKASETWPADTVLQELLALFHSESASSGAPWADGVSSARGTERFSPFRRMMLSTLHALNALLRGHLETAENEIRSALVQPQSWGAVIGLPLGVLILALTYQGKYEDIPEVLSVPVSDPACGSRFGSFYMYARGQYRLATRNHGAALYEFLRMEKVEKVLRQPADDLFSWKAGAAAAYLALGRRERAVELAKDVLATTDDEFARSRTEALRVIAQAQPVAQRLPLLREVSRLLEGAGDHVRLAHVHVDLARAHYALGDPKIGRALARRALSTAKASGCENVIREQLVELDSLDETPQAATAQPTATAHNANGDDGHDAVSAADLASLSQAETRVAELAAIGYSNRDIAAKLFVTVSTVEQHLTRIYRKLRIKHRSDLAAAVPSVVESRR